MKLDKISIDGKKDTIEKAVPLISSLLPLTGIGILLLYSRGGKF